VSRILRPELNRWANTAAAVVTTAFVVGGGSLAPHYVFFAAVEIACMALIIWFVWTRRGAEAAAPREAGVIVPDTTGSALEGS
jgi:hypothetical protein